MAPVSVWSIVGLICVGVIVLAAVGGLVAWLFSSGRKD